MLLSCVTPAVVGSGNSSAGRTGTHAKAEEPISSRERQLQGFMGQLQETLRKEAGSAEGKAATETRDGKALSRQDQSKMHSHGFSTL